MAVEDELLRESLANLNCHRLIRELFLIEDSRRELLIVETAPKLAPFGNQMGRELTLPVSIKRLIVERGTPISFGGETASSWIQLSRQLAHSAVNQLCAVLGKQPQDLVNFCTSSAPQADALIAPWSASTGFWWNHDARQIDSRIPPVNYDLAASELEIEIFAAVESEKRAASDAASSTNTTNNANIPKVFHGGLPSNPDVRDLMAILDATTNSRKPKIQIAREFTGENKGEDGKAKSLLAEIARRQRKAKSSK
ncbi:MAG: hypothetical protein C0485_09970 [Pirellula sp.]|nr:hypothetical protein [Pirellula sp.]